MILCTMFHVSDIILCKAMLKIPETDYNMDVHCLEQNCFYVPTSPAYRTTILRCCIACSLRRLVQDMGYMSGMEFQLPERALHTISNHTNASRNVSSKIHNHSQSLNSSCGTNAIVVFARKLPANQQVHRTRVAFTPDCIGS